MPKKTFFIDNEPVDVDEQYLNDFQKNYPNAEQATNFIVDNEPISVKLKDIDKFKINYPKAIQTLVPDPILSVDEYKKSLLNPEKTVDDHERELDFAKRTGGISKPTTAQFPKFTENLKQPTDEQITKLAEPEKVENIISVADFISKNQIKPRESEIINYNPNRILSEKEQQDWLGKLNIKRESQSKINEVLNPPSWGLGVLKNINIGTEQTVRISANAEKIVNGALYKAMGMEPEKGVIEKTADWIHERYVKPMPDLPNTVTGSVVSQLTQMPTGFFLPLFATPEIKIMGGAVTLLPKMPMLFGIKNALQATSEGGTPIDVASATAQGINEGLTMELFGFTAGKTGEAVSKLTKIQTTGQIANTLTNGGLFAGLTAAEGGDSKEIASSAALGAVLSAPGVASSLLMKKAISRFENSPAELIVKANELNTSVSDLRQQQQDLLNKSNSEKDPEKKASYIASANMIDAIIDLRVVSNDLSNNQEEAIKSVQEKDIPEEQKQVQVDKIKLVAAGKDLDDTYSKLRNKDGNIYRTSDNEGNELYLIDKTDGGYIAYDPINDTNKPIAENIIEKPQIIDYNDLKTKALNDILNPLPFQPGQQVNYKGAQYQVDEYRPGDGYVSLINNETQDFKETNVDELTKENTPEQNIPIQETSAQDQPNETAPESRQIDKPRIVKTIPMKIGKEEGNISILSEGDQYSVDGVFDNSQAEEIANNLNKLYERKGLTWEVVDANPQDDLSLDYKIIGEKKNDKRNITGVQGGERIGQEPEQTESNITSSQKQTGTSGVFQTPEQKVNHGDIINVREGEFSFKNGDWYSDDKKATDPNIIQKLNESKSEIDDFVNEQREKGTPEDRINSMLDIVKDQIFKYDQETYNPAIKDLVKNTPVDIEDFNNIMSENVKTDVPLEQKVNLVKEYINANNSENTNTGQTGIPVQESTPVEVKTTDSTGQHNKLIGLLREYNELPKNRSGQRTKLYQQINRSASELNYLIQTDKRGNLIATNGEKPIRTIPIKRSSEEIQSHKSLSDYDNVGFQSFVKKAISNPDIVNLPGINWGVTGKEKTGALNDIANNKKSARANDMLDAMTDMFNKSGVEHIEGKGKEINRTFIPLKEVFPDEKVTNEIVDIEDINHLFDINSQDYWNKLAKGEDEFVNLEFMPEQQKEIIGYERTNETEYQQADQPHSVSDRTVPEGGITENAPLPPTETKTEISGQGYRDELKNQEIASQEQKVSGQQEIPEVNPLHEKAKKEFGTTKEIIKGGYVLPDGTILDFSNGRIMRILNHSDIGRIFENKPENAKKEFINSGAILVRPESAGLAISIAPTPEQINTIKNYLDKTKGRLELELLGKEDAYVNYPKLTETSKILGDIKDYFVKGRVPKPEVVFSKSKKDVTETPEFKKWFGDSKVVDEKGMPLVMYHGTPTGDFSVFKPDMIFTSNKKYADVYQSTATSSRNPRRPLTNPKTYEVYLKIEKPFDTRVDERAKEIFDEFASDNGTEYYSYAMGLTDKGLPGWLEADNLKSFMQEKGYINDFDGFILDEGGIGGYGQPVVDRGISYMPFDPTQIKSIDNKGTFDTNNPDINFSKYDPFYSNTEFALNSIKQEKGTPEQWKAMLLKNGSKESELDWMDWDSFSKDKKSLTKEDIKNWIDGNKVEVKEVVKGSKLTPEQSKRYYELNTNYDKLTGDEMYEWDKLDNLVNNTSSDNTKYSQYTTPGGKNYKEVLLTLPVKIDGEIKARRSGVINNKSNIYGIYINDEFDGNYQGTSEENAIENYKKQLSRQDKSQFKSSHFDEPNIAVHVRMNEFTTKDGKKALNLEEVQSDWAQKGKKEGFKNNIKKPIYTETKPEDIELVEDKYQWKVKGSENKNYVGKGVVSSSEEAKKYLAKLINSNNQIKYNNQLKEFEKQVPIMPFKKTDQWVGLGMKWALRYASENGFDVVTWTSGETQASRYDLSKQVDRISYEVDKNTKKGKFPIKVFVYPKNGDLPIVKQPQNENELSDFVGKEIASKIVKNEGEFGLINNNGFKALSGLDLKVGGEGMKGFYDQILPTWTNKYLKKFGAKTGTSEIDIKPEITDSGIDLQTGEPKVSTEGKYLTVHSVELTPEIKGMALESQPMFNRSTEPIPFEKEQLINNAKNLVQKLDEKTPLGPVSFVGSSKTDLIQIMKENGESVHNVNIIEQTKENIKGFKTKEGVYLNAGTIKSELEAEKIFIHETIGHVGIEQFLKNNGIDDIKFFMKVHDSVKEEGFKKLADEIDQIEGNTIGSTYKAYEKEDTFTKGREYMAFLSQKILSEKDLTPVERNIWQQFVDILRGIINTRLRRDIPFTDKELAEIVRAGKNEVTGIAKENMSFSEKLKSLENIYNESKTIDEFIDKSGLSKDEQSKLNDVLPKISDERLDDYLKRLEKKCPVAEQGMTIGFTPGGEWNIIESLHGKTHEQGGIDLSIDKGTVKVEDNLKA